VTEPKRIGAVYDRGRKGKNGHASLQGPITQDKRTRGKKEGIPLEEALKSGLTRVVEGDIQGLKTGNWVLR